MLKKFSKKLKIHQIDFPRKGPSSITYVKGETEFFDSLKISKQVKRINEIKNDYDLCIVMSWAGARIAYLSGLNYVMYFTGNDIRTPPFVKNTKEPYLSEPVSKFNFIERLFYKNIFKNAIACVVYGPFFHYLDEYRKDGIKKDRIFVDTDIFNEKVIPLNQKKTKFTFFSPQRNGPEKGMEILWKALDLCKTDFEVIMVDWFDGRTQEEKQIVQDLLKKIPKQVKFVPVMTKENMAKYFHFCDAVIGQMRSGFNSGIEREAVLCRRLVVGYADPNIKYLLNGQNLEAPFVPKTKDPKTLAEILDRVVESKEFRNKLLGEEYTFVKEMADPDKCAKEWEDLFEELLKKHKSIHRKINPLKLKIINLIANLFENLVYNKKMREVNIKGWGKEEYERLMK